jgi:hypothetical protein
MESAISVSPFAYQATDLKRPARMSSAAARATMTAQLSSERRNLEDTGDCGIEKCLLGSVVLNLFWKGRSTVPRGTGAID